MSDNLIRNVVEQAVKEEQTTEEGGEIGNGMTLEEIKEHEAHADAVLAASDPDACSYVKGYVTRQALYACLTCTKDGEVGGVCLACSLVCHAECDLIELYTKRAFRCDCGNDRYKTPCSLDSTKTAKNEKNQYGQNYRGLYCSCARPYPDPECPAELEGDEMIQCIICEDWYHGRHLNVDSSRLESDDVGELICEQCTSRHEYLQYYNIDNNVEPVSETCTRPKDRPKEPKSAIFVRESFRRDLCRCEKCIAILDEAKLSFLIRTGDSMAEYERQGQELLEKGQEDADKQINGMLDQLDYRGQQEIAYGLNTMKNAMSSMLAQVQQGQEVTTEHIEIFKRKLKEDMEARKKRRIE